MYEDIEQVRRMIITARLEKYPITEEHLRELEYLVSNVQQLEDLGKDWGVWNQID